MTKNPRTEKFTTIELNISLVDEQGKELTAAEFVKWMTREMKSFATECDDGEKRLPSRWLEILEVFWSD